jgi:hypothetical protein
MRNKGTIMSVSTETLPTSHASRQSLIDDIETLSTRAQAEAAFSIVAISDDEENPWKGAGIALALAREQIAALEEQERVANFKSQVAIYRERHTHLREAWAKAPRLAEIQAEQSTLYMQYRENLGNPHFSPPINYSALYRTGKPTSTADAKERAIVKTYKALEDERVWLATAIETAQGQVTHLEQQNPYLVALGEQLDKVRA